jgi:hypothetical protein
VTELPNAEDSAAERVMSEAIVREFMGNLGIAADRFDEVEAGLRQLALLVEAQTLLRASTKVIEDPWAKQTGMLVSCDIATWLVEASKQATTAASGAGELWSLVHLVGAFGRTTRG